jgi:hypothetical protein
MVEYLFAGYAVCGKGREYRRMTTHRPSYADPWLAVFLALMTAASIIAAHGAYVFFTYLLDPWVAALATAVTAVGIPALDAAGTLEGRRSRAVLYWVGAFTFLGMETLANYFSGQAVFLANVLRAFAGKEGADLVWLAQEPAGRVLVVIYLAMPSLIVAYFAYAAASRWRMIRDARANFASRRHSRARTAQRLRGLRLDVRGLRNEIAAGGEVYEELKRTMRDNRLAAAREIEELREKLEQSTQAVRGAQQQARDVAQVLREREVEIKELREQAAQPFNLFANEPPTRARVLAYVREQMEAGRSRSEVARELGFPEATLRNWMEATNGIEVGH